MPISTDLNIDPYFDDFDELKNYYKILYKPSVAVQARELNQLQTILQNQIERFGDNIFKRGTIIEGCNVTLHSSFPYIKLKDTETDGSQVSVESYKNLYLKSSSNLTAYVVETVAGYETKAPDLNTLFVRYNSSGEDGNTTVFSANDILTVYNPSFPIFKYKVIDGSSNFSNSDSIVVMSAVAIQNSTGGSTFAAGAFNVNDVINNGVANAIVIEANTTANADYMVLKLKPKAGDLVSANTLLWKFANSENIVNLTTANTAKIIDIIGTGAEGSITTDSLGKITSISVASSGSGYYVEPYVGVAITSSGSASNNDINQLDVEARNYLTNITVANSAMDPIGTGYGISVDDGIIYQKGYFSRVDKQLLVVNKYSNTDFTKSVGFHTNEDIINSNQDTSLLDNATGTSNYTAPGADRLKLTPVLYVIDKTEADANVEFLPIVEFADGDPYKTAQQTVYNIIGDELAKRTYEESGNYVLDQFLLVSRDSSTFSDTASVFKMTIDPGKAYINGYRIETTDNYTANVAKGIDTVNNQNATIRVGYGNYVTIKETAGIFKFNYGDIVELYDTAKTYLTSSAGSAITPAGTQIGTARMRSLILDSGEAGSPTATYRLYLFDISMDTGKNFANVRSVYYDGTLKGIADVILNSSNNAVLTDNKDTALLFKSANAVQSANAVTYTYRTLDDALSANSTGYIRLSPPGGSETFPYAFGALGTIAKRDLIVIPLGNYQSTANVAGTIDVTTSSAVATGSGGADFTASFRAGDYVKIANSTANVIKQVLQVTNATSMTLTSNAGSTITGNAILYFPNNVPVTLTNRDTRTVTMEANGQLTIFVDSTVANATSGASTTANVAVVYNVTANNVVPTAKSVKREIYARISLANNAAGTLGPWALGISDTFRLRNVWKRTDGSSNTSVEFNSNTDVVDAANFINITDNPFANGDYVQYEGNNNITGLTDGNSYYIVYANNSGFAVSSTRNGANVNIAGIATSETQSFTGMPFYFAGDTLEVTEVTNEFYIDSNQKEDYLDTSYLYKKPRTNALGNNDVLLVKFDAFDTASAGVRTVKSYPINDSANLASLSNTYINTLEIPEMTGIDGRYYDIRDQFDFRPISSNTVPFTSELSNTSIVNPAEPSDTARFSSAEQKFPVPDTNLSANVTYYIGRNDRVVLDKNGDFTIVAGIPGVMDSYPPEPSDSITLQILEIPPYPSLPQALSAETVEILDTRIANEKYGTRKDIYRVSAPIEVDQRTRIQTKGYTMADISTLERRIKDLEYYVSFTLAETVAKMRFIGSSADPMLDRFKFGFFVDPFTNYSYADTENPEFYATITEDFLLPRQGEFNIEFEYADGPGIITPAYTEVPLILQNEATDGEINSVSNNVTTVVTQTTSEAIETNKNKLYSDTDAPYVYDDFFYTFSSLAGPAQFYMNCRDIHTAVEVFQSTTPTGPWVVSLTSASADAVTNNDITSKNLSNISRFPFEHPGSLQRKSYGPVGYWIEDQFRLVWNHNPTNGQYYKIRVYKGGFVGARAYAGIYAFKIFYPTDTSTNDNVTITSPGTFVYDGMVTSVNPPSFQIVMSQDLLSVGKGQANGVYVADSQKFIITVAGLKPNTLHSFKLAGVDKTNMCHHYRTSTNNSSGLKSDSTGNLIFEFYYDSGIDEATSDLQQRNRLFSATAGIKKFEVVSADNSSSADGVIDIKYYTNI